MKHLFVLSLLMGILLPGIISAQFGYGKISEIQELKNRKLLVVLEVPYEKSIKKLDKKGKGNRKEAYLSNITKFNQYLTETTQKFWNFSNKGIEYVTLAKADSLRRDKNTNYAVLYCSTGEASSVHSGFNENDRMDLIWAADNEDNDRSYLSKYFVSMKVALLEDLNKKPIWYSILMDGFPTKVSLINGMRTLQQYMDYRLRKKVNDEKINPRELSNDMVKANNPKLSKKILLIRDDLLSSKLDKRDIRNAYPYKTEVVNSARLDSLVMNCASEYAYAMILPAVNSGINTNEVFYLQEVFDCAGNELYAISKPNFVGNALAKSFSFGLVSAGHGSKDINAKTLKDFAAGVPL